jgi:NitT/TauT family transport system substrate-binding protein
VRSTRKYSTIAAAVAVVALALPLSACSSPAPEPSSDAPATLRVAFASQPDFTQIANFKWIEDLAANHNIEVEDLYFESSQDAFRALVAGEADVSLGTVTSAILLNATAGENVKVIASDLQAPDYILVTTPDIKTEADLQGKRVGISTPGDISDTLTRVVLEERDADPAGMDFVEIGGTSARMQALLSNQISAGAAHAAEGLSAVAQGLNKLFAYGESVPDYLQHGVIVQQTWLDENPELAQTIVDSFIDSVRWAASERDGYIALSQDYVEGIDDAVRNEAYDIFLDINMFAVNGGMKEDQLQNTLDIESRVGTFDDVDVPDLSEWSDSSYVEDYLSRNGEQ